MKSIVAMEILKQLGGSRFVAMTGAREFVAGEYSLKMKLGRGTLNKATHMRITLDASDTYTIEVFRWNARKLDMRTLSKESGFYCDMLQAEFKRQTGFDTHL